MLRIIDVGGTNEFWEQRGWAGRDDVQITLVNLKALDRRHPNIIPTAGNATDLSEHDDDSFDIAFSNSVIEHLFTFENQVRMATEFRRVASAGYWVQTPNFWFRSSPTSSSRPGTGCRRALAWRSFAAAASAGPAAARIRTSRRRIVEEHRLMRRRELARLSRTRRLLPIVSAGS
jgi:Methyltransferase domain